MIVANNNLASLVIMPTDKQISGAKKVQKSCFSSVILNNFILYCSALYKYLFLVALHGCFIYEEVVSDMFVYTSQFSSTKIRFQIIHCI